MESRPHPIIIQGGMGVAISSWPLARAVARAGQLGVVSGTALDVVLTRQLQLGDPGEHFRRALAAFPYPDVVDRILTRYFIPEGKSPKQPFRPVPLPSHEPSAEAIELLVVANFAEVYLAKESHHGLVGVNYLEKIQTPLLPSLFGAMLGGVDYVLMGAGIPRTIPGVLDQLSHGQVAELTLDVAGAGPDNRFVTRFDPRTFAGGEIPWLERPKFLAIVSSATLATMLARKSNGRVDGFVVEGPSAGGHNAPPRGAMQVNARGEPQYGPRDVADLSAFRALDLPFWLAGSYGAPERLCDALEAGAAGIQVGTAFAFCEESGLRNDLKQQTLALARRGDLDVFTDPVASPTGFPFKILRLPDTLSEMDAPSARKRQCDLGYLRHAYQRTDGSLGWRCPAEKEEAYVQKGGALADTLGRKCLCNALLANVGLGQLRENGETERPLVTSGDDVRHIPRYLPTSEATSYSAQDVISYLLSGMEGVLPSPQVSHKDGLV